MKKVMWASLTMVLTIALSLGAFANPAQARNFGNHSGLLMDPIEIEDGYIAGTFFGDPDFPIHIYRGIPYAAPPVGDLRWMPPQPPAPWSGIRECVNFSINPVQFAPGSYFPIGDPESEDCLYLNVLTPATNTNENLPVMVWFHGGGMWGSAGNQIDWNRHRLPQHGVVLVTVNMRLGALGLLAHPELSAESPDCVSGNYMFLDQIAALKWVQRNIAAFGGDPDNVTIFGQSGGGTKVAAMLVSPLAGGLFHRAIIQSSGGFEPILLDDAELIGVKYFEQLGVSTLEEARALGWQDLVDAFVAMGRRDAPTYPTDDDVIIPGSPVDIFGSGLQNAVPLMVQACLGELRPTSTMIPFFAEALTGNLNVGVKGYAAIFDQVPANWRDGGIVSFHALDLAYTFGIYDEPYANIWVQMTARTNPPQGPPELGEADKTVSEDMMTRFARFAKTGDPNVPGKSKRSVYWPAWTPSGDQYIYWNEGSQILTGFSEVGQ